MSLSVRTWALERVLAGSRYASRGLRRWMNLVGPKVAKCRLHDAGASFLYPPSLTSPFEPSDALDPQTPNSQSQIPNYNPLPKNRNKPQKELHWSSWVNPSP